VSFGMGSSFNEPRNNDTTSAPPEVDPGNVQPSVPGKKKKTRDPGPLARAIAMSKRAKQSTYKNG